MELGQLNENGRLRSLATVSFVFILISVIYHRLPFGTAFWVLYIPLISLTFFIQRPKVPIIFAILSVIWVFSDFFMFEVEPVSSKMFLRRMIGAVAFFSVAIIVRYAILANLAQKNLRRALEKTSIDLADQKLKLERSNRELEQFAGIAAHDLRSPIATMHSWADMLSALIPPPRSVELDQTLSVIQRNAKKAEDVIKSVLELSRVNVAISHTDHVELNKTLIEIQMDLKNEIIDSGAQIHVGPLPTIQANQIHLESVFRNLIRNALIYREKSRASQIFVGYTEQADTYQFFVKDNGIGIDPRLTEHIFKMFGRLHDETEFSGNGIGLAFCKKVVESRGGKIWVESCPGKGSTFFLPIPKCKIFESRQRRTRYKARGKFSRDAAKCSYFFASNLEIHGTNIRDRS